MKALSLSIRAASRIDLETGSRNGVQTPGHLSISLYMNAAAKHMISKLGLIPLPQEGGFYKSTWTSAARGPDGRALGSAILFLMTEGDFSALHRLSMDEIWHFHAGDPVELTRIDPRTGSRLSIVLGPDIAGGNTPQEVVPAGEWQGARLCPGATHGWALLGCTLSPAWDERGFELGSGAALVREFPAHAEIIRSLTR
jgi:predicted cupin superfamily sugar epimerase